MQLDKFDRSAESHGAGRRAGRRGRVDRRTALVGFATSAALVGCHSGSDTQPNDETKPAHSTVPLRVLLVGNENEAAAIKQAWLMSNEQPLEVELASPDDLNEKCRLVDVVVMPQEYLGTAVGSEAIVDFKQALLDSFDEQYGKQQYAVIDGLGNFGRSKWGIPVGAKLLALLAQDANLELKTWADYHDWVESIGGKAAEPLAPGWAVASFLNRCSTTITDGWMFDRTSMQPRIDGDPYVAVLEQLLRTAKLYKNIEMNPAEIWNGIRKGSLAGGIGYSAPAVNEEATASQGSNEDEEFEISVFDCPLEADSDRVFFIPHAPLVCLSVGCRQTDASKGFIGWLSGGEQINQVWQQADLMCSTRVLADDESIQAISPYNRWLSTRLGIRQVSTSLTIPGANEYHRTLDQGVRAAIAGELSAEESLAEVAKTWESITDRLDRDSQTTAWKRSLGFGG